MLLVLFTILSFITSTYAATNNKLNLLSTGALDSTASSLHSISNITEHNTVFLGWVIAVIVVPIVVVAIIIFILVRCIECITCDCCGICAPRRAYAGTAVVQQPVVGVAKPVVY